MRCAASVVVCLALLCSSSSAEEPAWRELFNGKDLTGWKANMHPGDFTIVDGAIKAHGKDGMAHLFYVGDGDEFVPIVNFELEAVCRGEPGANAGIFFHTDHELRSGKYLNKGYEVQLNSTEKEKRKTGSLYAVVDLDTSPIDETQWFTVKLRVEGKRIQVWLNGQQVQDYTEPPNPERAAGREKRLIDPKGGALALQAHDPESIFYFKSIRLRELPAPSAQ
jgi:hypothetical protein